jgi:hypothetical protein
MSSLVFHWPLVCPLRVSWQFLGLPAGQALDSPPPVPPISCLPLGPPTHGECKPSVLSTGLSVKVGLQTKTSSLCVVLGLWLPELWESVRTVVFLSLG